MVSDVLKIKPNRRRPELITDALDRRAASVLYDRHFEVQMRDSTRPPRADGSRDGLQRVSSSVVSTVPSPFVLAVNRMGYGPTSGQRAEFNALGPNDDARFDAYVDQQLDPDSIVDTEYDAQVAVSGFTTLDKSLLALWTNHHSQNSGGYSNRILPVEESEFDMFLRGIYSKKQLEHQMTMFWLDHFNVYGWDYWSLPVWSHWVREIRSRCFGQFRDLLFFTAKHPAMLYYLDQYTSTVAGPNENYSRELFELHTLGAENYYGVIPWTQVPTDSQGTPMGYVDDDVFECTRCLTGWSVGNGNGGSPDNGHFYYRPSEHDRFQKIVLGNFIPADQGDLQDGHDVLNMLFAHPGTARHIAGKLCRRFISDNPPQALIDQVADTFYQTRSQPDQIKQTMEVVLKSNEFKTTWNEKVKRPFEILVGFMRGTRANYQFRENGADIGSLLWRYDQTSNPLFSWPTPDGYPDEREKWESTTVRVMTWRLLLWLVDETTNGQPHFNAVAATLASARSANELVDFWVNRLLARAIDPTDRQELVDFMAQGINPNTDLDLTDEDTEERLRMMVALILNSPEALIK